MLGGFCGWGMGLLEGWGKLSICIGIFDFINHNILNLVQTCEFCIYRLKRICEDSVECYRGRGTWFNRAVLVSETRVRVAYQDDGWEFSMAGNGLDEVELVGDVLEEME